MNNLNKTEAEPRLLSDRDTTHRKQDELQGHKLSLFSNSQPFTSMDYYQDDFGELQSGQDMDNGETQLDPNAIVFRNQRKQFLNQFAVTFNLPGFIINESQMYPKDLQYFLSSERYSFPDDVKLMNVRPSVSRKQMLKNMKIGTIETADMQSSEKVTDIKFLQGQLEQIEQISDRECSLTLRKQTASGVGCEIVDQFKFRPNQFYMKKFKFSDSGNLFIICSNLDTDIIQIYDSSTDIEKLLSERVANQKFISEVKHIDLKEARKIVFSQNEQYLFVGTDRSILKFKVQTGQLIKRHLIPEVYELLLSLNVNQDGSDGIILCKKQESKIASLMRLSKIKESKIIQDNILFTKEGTAELRCKVSEDFKRVFLNNDEDNIFYEDKRQMQIPWFKELNVYKIIEVPYRPSVVDQEGEPEPPQLTKNTSIQNQVESTSAFLCIASKPYDNFIIILHSHDPEFLIKIDRQVTKKNYQFMDAIFKNDTVKILSSRDGELFIDSITLNLDNLIIKNNDDQYQQHYDIKSYYDTPFKSMEFQWPFVGFIYQSKDLMLISAHIPKTIFRFSMPKKTERLLNLHITQKLELYYSTIGEDNKFNLYRVDGIETLVNTGTENFMQSMQSSEAPQLFLKWYHTPLFKYDLQQVNNHPQYQLWVRSSSVKSGLKNAKSDSRFFMLHKSSLYTWVEGESMSLIADNIKHCRYINEDTIFFEQVVTFGKKKKSVSVNRISIVYSAIRIETIYEEQRPDSKIQNYSIDYTLNRVYILCKYRNQAKNLHEILIVDRSNYAVIASIDIDKQSELYGPFKSGINFLINGNFYYQNLCMRLDPLNPHHKLFTTYDGIIPMQSAQQLLFISPKISFLSKKILYIKKDREKKALRTAIILPYLDERKIVICPDRTKASSLWTLSEHLHINQSLYDNQLKRQNTLEVINEDNKDNSVDKDMHSSFQHPDNEKVNLITSNVQNQTPWWNRRSWGFSNQAKANIKSETDLIQYRDSQRILHIDQQNAKIFVYSIKGMLLKTQPFFIDKTISSGDIIATSQDYKMMVFRNLDPLRFTVRTFDIEHGYQKVFWDINVEDLILKNDKLMYLLIGDLATQFSSFSSKSKEQLLPQYGIIKSNFVTEQDLNENNQNRSQDLNQDTDNQNRISSYIMDRYRMKIDVNNDGTIGLFFIQKQENKLRDLIIQGIRDNKQINKMKDDIPFDSKKRVFLVIKKRDPQNRIVTKQGNSNKRISNLSPEKDYPQLQFYSNESDFPQARFAKKFILTREHIFFWNKQTIYYINHCRTSNSSPKLKQINFNIPFKDIKRNTISEVFMPSTQERDSIVVFKVNQNQSQSTLVIWDLKQNIEQDSYDVANEALVMFDAKDEVYVIENDHVVINDSGGRCFAYQLEGCEYLEHQDDDFKYDRGLRVDHYHQNFLLIRDQLHLGNSYLSILINETNAMNEYSKREFDPLAFPYYFNRRTELHHFINDSSFLEQILQHYNDNDSRILDHILLINDRRETPLHYATLSDNSRSLNLLLTKLSVVRVNNTDNFKDIFDNFLDYPFFEDYLNLCYFQTEQMRAITSLNIPKKGDQEEATVIENTNTFLTLEQLNSATQIDAPSQPVTVKGLDLYWILNSEEGRIFLHKLSMHDNVNFFMTEFVKTLITFLWSHYRKLIIQWVMLPFLAYFALFIALIFYNENYFTKEGFEFEEGEKEVFLGLSISLLVMIVYFYNVLIRKIITLKWLSLKSFWMWLNLVSNTLNLAIVIITFMQNTPLIIRRLESVASVLMWFRFLYFFRIIDETAPLVRMIWQILFDMRAFIFIFILIILAFANGFYVLAKNQQDLTDDVSDIPYFTYRQSIIYVYLASIGEFNTDSYVFGEKEEDLLWGFFVFTTFLLSIVLLNMLIAIMGQTYEKVSEYAQAQMMREHILMIMENFFLQKKGTFKRAKYLISFAQRKQIDDQRDQQNFIVDEIKKAMEELKKEMKQEFHTKFKNNISQMGINKIGEKM